MFCDGRAATKEDAWPLWLVRMFPNPVGVEVEAHRSQAAPMTWRQRGHFAKVKFVCQPCNNGWMSRLENEAKPIIQDLLASDRVSFASEERELVARWILKTAMVFEAVGGRGWFYTPEERATVRSGVIPTGYTAFWVARCVNLPGAYTAANNMFESAALSTSGVHGHVTTLAISTIAFQVLTVRSTAAVPANAVIQLEGANVAPWPQVAMQLWPPLTLFNWPPTMGLDGELGVETFANRLRKPEIPAPVG